MEVIATAPIINASGTDGSSLSELKAPFRISSWLCLVLLGLLAGKEGLRGRGGHPIPLVDWKEATWVLDYCIACLYLPRYRASRRHTSYICGALGKR